MAKDPSDPPAERAGFDDELGALTQQLSKLTDEMRDAARLLRDARADAQDLKRRLAEARAWHEARR